MTKMAAMPMFGINTYNLLSRNQWADFDETCNEASRLKLIIFCSMITLANLDIFYSMVKFCKLGFYMGKSDNDGFFGNYCIL